MEAGEHENFNGVGPNSLDKERNMVNDDPKWQGKRLKFHHCFFLCVG